MAALLAGWWSAIWPNLAASVIWATPTFLLHHRALKRHVDKRHEELVARLTSEGDRR
jgi:hypothetical protein